MNRTLKRALGFTAGGLAMVAIALGTAVGLREDRHFEAALPDIHASADPEVVARGRYLVYGLAHCADCHGAPEQNALLKAGAEVPLSGGFEFRLPVGIFRVPNITPDMETGIGRFRDQQIARSLRYGVHPDGRAVLPFMRYADLSDADLTAIISYLRAVPAVRHAVPAHAPNWLGRVVKAFVLGPKGPSGSTPASVVSEPSVVYGRYLANSVADCAGCHTEIDEMTGAYAGPLFGGAEHDSDTDPSETFMAPNLTSDPRSGHLANWSEDAFIARLHAGAVLPRSPMPWHAFKRMTDDDARAIFRYLRTLPSASGADKPPASGALADSTRH